MVVQIVWRQAARRKRVMDPDATARLKYERNRRAVDAVFWALSNPDDIVSKQIDRLYAEKRSNEPGDEWWDIAQMRLDIIVAPDNEGHLYGKEKQQELESYVWMRGAQDRVPPQWHNSKPKTEFLAKDLWFSMKSFAQDFFGDLIIWKSPAPPKDYVEWLRTRGLVAVSTILCARCVAACKALYTQLGWRHVEQTLPISQALVAWIWEEAYGVQHPLSFYYGLFPALVLEYADHQEFAAYVEALPAQTGMGTTYTVSRLDDDARAALKSVVTHLLPAATAAYLPHVTLHVHEMTPERPETTTMPFVHTRQIHVNLDMDKQFSRHVPQAMQEWLKWRWRAIGDLLDVAFRVFYHDGMHHPLYPPVSSYAIPDDFFTQLQTLRRRLIGTLLMTTDTMIHVWYNDGHWARALVSLAFEDAQYVFNDVMPTNRQIQATMDEAKRALQAVVAPGLIRTIKRYDDMFGPSSPYGQCYGALWNDIDNRDALIRLILKRQVPEPWMQRDDAWRRLIAAWRTADAQQHLYNNESLALLACFSQNRDPPPRDLFASTLTGSQAPWKKLAEKIRETRDKLNEWRYTRAQSRDTFLCVWQVGNMEILPKRIDGMYDMWRTSAPTSIDAYTYVEARHTFARLCEMASVQRAYPNDVIQFLQVPQWQYDDTAIPSWVRDDTPLQTVSSLKDDASPLSKDTVQAFNIATDIATERAQLAHADTACREALLRGDISQNVLEIPPVIAALYPGEHHFEKRVLPQALHLHALLQLIMDAATYLRTVDAGPLAAAMLVRASPAYREQVRVSVGKWPQKRRAALVDWLWNAPRLATSAPPLVVVKSLSKTMAAWLRQAMLSPTEVDSKVNAVQSSIEPTPVALRLPGHRSATGVTLALATADHYAQLVAHIDAWADALCRDYVPSGSFLEPTRDFVRHSVARPIYALLDVWRSYWHTSQAADTLPITYLHDHVSSAMQNAIAKIVDNSEVWGFNTLIQLLELDTYIAFVHLRDKPQSWETTLGKQLPMLRRRFAVAMVRWYWEKVQLRRKDRARLSLKYFGGHLARGKDAQKDTTMKAQLSEITGVIDIRFKDYLRHTKRIDESI